MHLEYYIFVAASAGDKLTLTEIKTLIYIHILMGVSTKHKSTKITFKHGGEIEGGGGRSQCERRGSNENWCPCVIKKKEKIIIVYTM